MALLLLVLSVGDHNHCPDEFQVRRGTVLKRIYSKIADDATVPVRRVYDQVVVEGSQHSEDYTPSFENVRSRSKRFRSSFIPPIPADIADVDINGVWKRTR